MKNKLTMRQRVRVYMAERDITQGELAAECNISGAKLSMILAGKCQPSLTEALRLQDVTGIPVVVFAKSEAA